MPAHLPDSRKALRTRLRDARRAIPASERIAAATALADQLRGVPFAPDSGFAAGYWAMDGEIALHAWQLALPPGTTYCLPVLGDGRLRFAPWRAGEPLVTNRFGIPEPDVPETALLDASAMRFVVVPLVGFDASGQRIGMGGGWYDRTFAFRSAAAAPPWLVGAGFALQQVDAVARESWDVGLDAVCTERATFLANRSHA